jgi:hypothetical protein
MLIRPSATNLNIEHHPFTANPFLTVAVAILSALVVLMAIAVIVAAGAA